MALEEVPKKKHKGMPLDLDNIDKRWTALLNDDIEEMGHDVTFLVGNKENISCHKLFLAAASPVFQKMLFGQLKSADTIIEIPDVDPQAFKNILQFAYRKTLKVAISDAVMTMYTANKYQLPELVSHCSDLLTQNLNAENAVTIYHSAEILDNVDLRKKSYAFVLERFMEIIPTSGFLDLSADNLCELLKSDELLVDSELDVFSAVIRWGKEKNSEKKLSELLVDIIKHVRFPLMGVSTFLEKVEPMGVLSDGDAFSILKFINWPREKKKEFKDLKFNQKCRKGSLFTFNTNLDFYSVNKVLGVRNYCYLKFPQLVPDSNWSIYLEEVELICDTKGSSEEIVLDLALMEFNRSGKIVTAKHSINLQATVSKTKSVLINTRIGPMHTDKDCCRIFLIVRKGMLGIPRPQLDTDKWETTNLKYKRGLKNVDLKFEYTAHSTNIMSLKFSIRRAN